ncbi:fimbria/pilus periplasmic chaperone [Providencia rettgeri]|uniref:fimbria/pilus periplasmic chaperone n=1 Tax=Providencia rettgeri TaxID=587 RepID=UPI000F799B32|nr:molecular chaperone [Providencia rettgeri]
MKKIIQTILATFFVSQSAFSAVSLDHSRVIFTQDDKSQSITAHNSGGKKYLLQSLIFSTLESENTPSENFTIIPPIVKLKENSNTALKIIPKSLASLPNDQESLFYVMTNFIPESKQKNNDDNDKVNTRFNLSTKIVIKMFYRPNGIEGHVNDYINKLTATQSGNKIIIKNPSPYYFTLVNIKMDKVSYESDRAPMVAPFSSIELPANNKVSQIEWDIINDYGGETKVEPIALKGTQK